MSEFVPESFEPPLQLVGDGFKLEPLGPQHNGRDHEAWSTSIEHIRATPGFETWSWPTPMTLDENLADLVEHAEDFAARTGFTYSVVHDGDVIGCVYIYPSGDDGHDAHVRSWVRASHADLDRALWEAVRTWLAHAWPFESVRYADR